MAGKEPTETVKTKKGGILRRILRPSKWQLMDGLGPEEEAAAAEERVGPLEYRKPNSKTWSSARARLRDGWLTLSSPGGEALLALNLAFSILQFERKRQKLDVEVGRGLHHHLRMGGVEDDFEAWIHAFYAHRVQAQAAFLAGPSPSAVPARLSAQLSQGLTRLCSSLKDAKRRFIAVRTSVAGPDSTSRRSGKKWFRPSKNLRLTEAESDELAALLSVMETIFDDLSAQGTRLVTEARGTSHTSGVAAHENEEAIRMRLTKSREHVVLSRHATPHPTTDRTDEKSRTSARAPSASSSSEEESVDMEPLTQQLSLRPSPPSSSMLNASLRERDPPPKPLARKSPTSKCSSASKQPYKYREVLPAPKPKSLAITFGVVMKALAENSLPLPLFEPIGTLQRLSEQLEFSDLMDSALKEADPVRRMGLVCGFATAGLSGTLRRTGKPFNPLLGETYTLDRWEERGWRYMGEQVTHSPDVSACHAEGKAGWALSGIFQIGRPRFSFSYVSIAPIGLFHIFLLPLKETYRYQPAETRLLHPISPDKRRIHHDGTVVVTCSSGLEARLKFVTGSLDVSGRIFRTSEPARTLGTLSGQWPEVLRLSVGTAPEMELFRAPPRLPDAESYYSFGRFARALNEVGDKEKGRLPSTDSRFRPDQLAFEAGRLNAAQALKETLESEQRRRKKTPGSEIRPRWFSSTAADPAKDTFAWTSNQTYWPAHADAFKGQPAFPPIFALPK